MILGGIDIGTNTIRLLVAQVGDRSHRELHSHMHIARLGQGLDRTGILAPDAQERSLAVLEEYSRILRGSRVDGTAAVGTSALRKAGNAAEFLSEAERRAGIAISVISAEEEARLTLLGVRRALAAGANGDDGPLASALMIDIGGGSTELVVVRNGAVHRMASLPLGAVYLTERYLHRVPPGEEEMRALRAAVGAELGARERDLLRPDPDRPALSRTCVGTAGTITTLAAMDQRLVTYEPGRINGYVLSRASLDGMVNTLSRATRESRRRIAGLGSGREDIILAGAVVAQEILLRCGATDMLVSDWGLREGVVFDLYERLRAGRTE